MTPADAVVVRADEYPLEDVVTREARVAVELGRQHLEPCARGAKPDVAARAGERLEQACRIRRSRGPGDAQEDALGSHG